MELKPCPFCGGEADVTRYYKSGVEVGSAIVCNNCGVSVHHVEADCAEENIKAWNRRANNVWRTGNAAERRQIVG